MASRAFSPRLRSASSNWFRSIRTGGRSLGISTAIRTVGSNDRDIISAIPRTTSDRLIFSGFRSCRRAKASMRFVSAAPRSAASIARPSQTLSRSFASACLRASSRFACITMRRLLKSWARPPVSWPRLSSFCISATLASASSRSRVRASTRISKSAFVAASSAVRSATRFSSSALSSSSSRVFL